MAMVILGLIFFCAMIAIIFPEPRPPAPPRLQSEAYSGHPDIQILRDNSTGKQYLYAPLGSLKEIEEKKGGE